MTKIRFLILIATITLFGTCYAQKVDETTARNIGVDFLSNKKKSSTSSANRMPAKESFELAYTATKDGKDCYYVYNCNSGGFVIVSADDRTSKPILGYSTTGTFNSEKLGINVKSWLDTYSTQILALDTIQENPISRPTTRAIGENRHFIEPLVKVTWGQGEPYNKMCPKDYYGQQCITGCVATAMAQVIYSLKYPTKVNAVNAYTTTRGINVPSLEPTTFDRDYFNEDEIAKLMRYCGQAVMMNYGPDYSGADMYEVEKALETTFGFSVCTALMEHNNYNETQWSELLYSELSSDRPMIYAGRGTGGHAFVVDGYDDAEDLFHVNWGWEGDCDGYYIISSLIPTPYDDYSDDQMAIVGMLPKATQISDDTSVNISYFDCVNLDISKDSDTNGYTFECGNWKVESDLNQEGGIEIGLGLYDQNNQFIKVLTYERIDLFNTWLYHDYNPTVEIDGSLSLGEYKIYLVSKIDESSSWRKSKGSDRFYINMSVEPDLIKIRPVPDGDNFSSRYRDFGTVKIGDLYYHLFYDYRYFANLSAGDEPYKGDLYIPDYVEYNGDIFTLLDWEIDILNSPDLNSVSLGMRGSPQITDSQINNLELREGVQWAFLIASCNNLSELIYPSSCLELQAPSQCNNLKKIVIKYTGQVKIKLRENGSWSEESMPQLRDIYIHSEYPPKVIKEYDFELTCNPNVQIHIPEGSKLAYLNSEWKDWNLIEDLPSVNKNRVEIDYIGEDYDSAGFGPYSHYENCDIEFGIKIPSEDLHPYIGAAITGVKFFTTEVLGNDNFWENAEYVLLTDDENDYLIKKDCITLRGQWTEVKFDTPYHISDNVSDIYLGIGRASVLLHLYANNNYVWNGAYKRIMQKDSDVDYDIEYGKWDKDFPLSLDEGCTFRIKAIIEGENFPTDIVIAYERPTCVDNKLRARLHSRTLDNVESVSMSMTIDGTLYPEQTVTTSLVTNHDQYVDLKLPDDISEGYHELELRVISVNGLPDEIDSNSNRSGTIYFNIDNSGNVESVLSSEDGPFDVFDLKGIKVKTQTDNISDLPNGIYIINGQKFVVNK